MADETKKCPFCAEDIKAEAIVCRFCGYDLRTGKPPQIPAIEDLTKTAKSIRSRQGIGSGTVVLILLVVIFLAWLLGSPR